MAPQSLNLNPEPQTLNHSPQNPAQPPLVAVCCQPQHALFSQTVSLRALRKLLGCLAWAPHDGSAQPRPNWTEAVEGGQQRMQVLEIWGLEHRRWSLGVGIALIFSCIVPICLRVRVEGSGMLVCVCVRACTGYVCVGHAVFIESMHLCLQHAWLFAYTHSACDYITPCLLVSRTCFHPPVCVRVHVNVCARACWGYRTRGLQRAIAHYEI